MTVHVNSAGRRLLIEFEGFAPHPYPDPASPLARATRGRPWGRLPATDILAALAPAERDLSGAPWTIGHGFTDGVGPDDPPMTEEAAEARLSREIDHFAQGVLRMLTRPANENELSAMVVLAFNIGLTAFARSTVLRLHNAGNREGAARAFALWNKAGGRVMPGLVRRRAAEAALYLKPVLVPMDAVGEIERLRPDAEIHVEHPDVMPQKVDAEMPLTRSPIMRGAGVAGGVSTLTLAAEGARAVGEIRFSLGDWLPYIALGVVAIAAVWIIVERVKMRREGRA